jgi:hypothetical protein
MISTLNALVDYSFSPDGDLFNVSWKACKAKRDRSSILHQVLQVLCPVTPGPLELKFGNSLVSPPFDAFQPHSGKMPKTCSKGHRFIVYINGTCMACGFDLQSMMVCDGATNDVDTTQISLYISKACHHKGGTAYGQCRGEEKKDIIKQMIPKKSKVGAAAKVRPRNLMETQARLQSDSACYAMNQGGLAIGAYTVYNVQRESIKHRREVLGLVPSNDSFGWSRAIRFLRERDLDKRAAQGDKSVDYPGMHR